MLFAYTHTLCFIQRIPCTYCKKEPTWQKKLQLQHREMQMFQIEHTAPLSPELVTDIAGPCSVAAARTVSPRSTGHHLTCSPRWQGQHRCHRTGFRAVALETELPWLVAAADFTPFSLLFSALSLLFCNASSAYRRTCSTALGEFNCFRSRNRYCKFIQLVHKAYAFCSQIR